MSALVADEQREVEVRLGRGLDVPRPLLHVLALALVERGHHVAVQLRHFVGLFALQQRRIQRLQLLHGHVDAFHQPAAPNQRAAAGRQVEEDDRVLLAFVELLLDLANVRCVVLQQEEVLLVELVLDVLPLDEVAEALEKPNLPVQGAAVAALKLGHRLAEGQIVGLEGRLVDVHEVVVHRAEATDRQLEVRRDDLDGHRELLALRSADLNIGEALELQHGVCRALRVGDVLVLEVCALEGAADAEELPKPLARVLDLAGLCRLEDGCPRDAALGLLDERVADLADQHHEVRGRVVVLRVLPDEQDDVHHGLEDLLQLLEVHVGLLQLHAPALQRAQVLDVVVRLHLGVEDLLAEPRELPGVARLVHEAEQATHRGALKLIADVVQVLRLPAPEGQLHFGSGMKTLLQQRLGIAAQHVPNLVGPRDDGALEQRHHVLLLVGRRLHVSPDALVQRLRDDAFGVRVEDGQRQARLAHEIAAHDGRAGHEVVELPDHFSRGDLSAAPRERLVGERREVQMPREALQLAKGRADAVVRRMPGGHDHLGDAGLQGAPVGQRAGSLAEAEQGALHFLTGGR
eukprot:scaffold7359_cov255-Pinguiococcus_pyrenoidosus.AAC.27